MIDFSKINSIERIIISRPRKRSAVCPIASTPIIEEGFEPEQATLLLILKKGGGKKVTIKSARQKSEIIVYLTDHIPAKSADIAELLGVKSTRVKQLLRELQDEGIVVTEGGNRNRIYKLKS